MSSMDRLHGMGLREPAVRPTFQGAIVTIVLLLPQYGRVITVLGLFGGAALLARVPA